jgi:hypothetical protein
MAAPAAAYRHMVSVEARQQHGRLGRADHWAW